MRYLYYSRMYWLSCSLRITFYFLIGATKKAKAVITEHMVSGSKRERWFNNKIVKNSTRK